jgi:hypothetical protein
MVGFELALQLSMISLYLPRTVKAVSTMALLAPIPITQKIKSNGGNALHIHHRLFLLNANLNISSVIVKNYFLNYFFFSSGGLNSFAAI